MMDGEKKDRETNIRNKLIYVFLTPEAMTLSTSRMKKSLSFIEFVMKIKFMVIFSPFFLIGLFFDEIDFSNCVEYMCMLMTKISTADAADIPFKNFVVDLAAAC